MNTFCILYWVRRSLTISWLLLYIICQDLSLRKSGHSLTLKTMFYASKCCVFFLGTKRKYQYFVYSGIKGPLESSPFSCEIMTKHKIKFIQKRTRSIKNFINFNGEQNNYQSSFNDLEIWWNILITQTKKVLTSLMNWD